MRDGEADAACLLVRHLRCTGVHDEAAEVRGGGDEDGMDERNGARGCGAAVVRRVARSCVVGRRRGGVRVEIGY